VFNIDLEILFAKYEASLLKDLRELPSREAVFVIIRDPGLKTTHSVLTKGSPTVDELFADSRDLCDVSVRRRELSSRK
jgi:hypothetical protein